MYSDLALSQFKTSFKESVPVIARLVYCHLHTVQILFDISTIDLVEYIHVSNYLIFQRESRKFTEKSLFNYKTLSSIVRYNISQVTFA